VKGAGTDAGTNAKMSGFEPPTAGPMTALSVTANATKNGTIAAAT
jgi:hypothetical protein